MDWFRFNIIDYQRDTAKLGPTGDGIYLRLMLHYYQTESPLPNDFGALCRISGAMTRHEKDVLRMILNSMFGDSPNGELRHKRIDQEIEQYQQRSATNRSNVVNGRYTNRLPIKNKKKNIGESRSVRQRAREDARDPHSKSDALNGKTALPDGFRASDRVRTWALVEGIELDELDRHVEAFTAKVRKHGYRYADWDEALMAAIREDWAHLRLPGKGAHTGSRNQGDRDDDQSWIGNDGYQYV